MALTKISSTVIQSGAVTAEKVATGVIAPSISNVQIANSSWSVLDDTAVSLDGGYILINGSNFTSGCSVLINNTPATSVTFANSSQLRVEVPSANAGTYVAYVVNPGGGTAIGVNALTYSATPSWVTGSTLTGQRQDTAISIQLEATDATTYALADGSSLPANTTLASNGLFSGTVTGLEADTNYSFTVVATDAENQDSPRTFSINITVVPIDPYFNYNVLLLGADGTSNTTQNQTFADTSGNALTVTPQGNPRQGSFSPFSPSGWSVYFDGSGDYLTMGTTSSFNFLHDSNALFTIEGWVFVPTLDSGVAIFGTNSGGSSEIGTIIWLSSGYIRLLIGKGSSGNAVIDATSASAITANQWVHIAVTYDQSAGSSNAKFYINGVAAGTASKTGNTPSSSAANYAGRINAFGTTAGGAAFISNVRVSNSIIYSSDFTPATAPLTSSSQSATGVALLTCQSNRFIDNSSNAFTITKVGDTAISPFAPFAPEESYDPATHGGSIYVDGNDFFNFTQQSLPTFTAECWAYPTANAGVYAALFGAGGGSGGGATNVQLTINNDGSTTFVMSATSIGSSPAGTVKFKAWNHIAFVRSGSSCATFVNGARVATGTFSGDSLFSQIGSLGYLDGSYNPIGYLSDVRISNTALYDPAQTTYTIPTTPLTADSSTKLLLKGNAAGIYDATTKNVFETAGNAQVRTDIKKYGTGSLYFDGTGDYVVAPSTPAHSLASGNFTVECWFRTTTTAPNAQGIIAKFSGNAVDRNSLQFLITFNQGTLYCNVYQSTNNNDIAFTSLSANTWYHVALVREGNTVSAYLNGVKNATTRTISGSLNDNASWPLYVGNYAEGGSSYPFNGYIDDVRITKGIARYTSNFTPPTEEFPVQ